MRWANCKQWKRYTQIRLHPRAEDGRKCRTGCENRHFKQLYPGSDVNPDFGQVESDPSVMNLTAFETFYEEKRPFFLEGLTIFDYKFDNESLFYSRRIGHSPSVTPESNDVCLC